MLLLVLGACNTPSPPHASSTGATPLPSPSPVTAADLQRGHWSVLPTAPIQPREMASVVWTGREVLVWGGRTSSGDTTFADGAAYDPVARRWRKLHDSPLSPRWGQATVWTGSEMIVWGGMDLSQLLAHSIGMADGAAYNPTSNSWQKLPRGPLSGRGSPLSVWTGSEVVVLGGRSGDEDYTDAAAFDPRAWRWRSFSVPQPPSGHSLTWRAAVFADDQLLAWSEWATSRQIGPDAYSGMAGADLFSYSLDERTWRLIPPSRAALPDVEEVLVANAQVIVRGTLLNCWCPYHPPVAVASAMYNPVTMAWFRLPPDPLGLDNTDSVWTGAALFSFNPMAMRGITGPSGKEVVTLPPGAASAYDAGTNQWVGLPTAPVGCGGPSEPSLWTGLGVVVSCSEPFTSHSSSIPATAAAAGFGLVFEVS
jgi:hypothetical protein